jgi:hypothetical protein
MGAPSTDGATRFPDMLAIAPNRAYMINERQGLAMRTTMAMRVAVPV